MGKTLVYGGSRFVFSGREGDQYYDHLGQHAAACGEIEIAARILHRDAIIFDVGANIGVTTLAFASIATEGCVFSFEPLAGSFRYLEQNIAANRAESARFGRVEAMNVACGASSGLARMYEDNFSAASFLINDKAGDPALPGVEVKIVRLDDVAKVQRIERLDFVKIDVEGFELDVLAGMQEVLSRFRPIVCLEFNSFCLIANAEVLPSTFLTKICSQFERVAVATESGLQFLNNAGDRRVALAFNLVHHGCLDTLICFPSAEQYESALRRAGGLGLDTRPTYVAL